MTGQCWSRQALGNWDFYNVLPISIVNIHMPSMALESQTRNTAPLLPCWPPKYPKFLWSKQNSCVSPSSMAGFCRTVSGEVCCGSCTPVFHD